MSTQMEHLAIELLGLPASSRALLAKQLLASLDEDELQDVGNEWLEEINRRDEQITAGSVEGIPAEDVMRRARERVQ